MTRIAFAALTLAFLASPAAAEMIDGNRIVVIDGNTVGIPCASSAPGCSEIISFVDIDAPETFRPNCDEALRAGFKAKARLALLLRGKQIWIERTSQKDPYRRILGVLRIGGPNGVNAGMELVREELALPYKPGAKAKEERRRNWCGGRP